LVSLKTTIDDMSENKVKNGDKFAIHHLFFEIVFIDYWIIIFIFFNLFAAILDWVNWQETKISLKA